MMNCKRTQERLSAYLDQEMSAEEMQQVADHVQYCVGCAQELAEERALKSMLKKLPTAGEPPAHLEERLVAAVFQEARQRPVRRLAPFAVAAFVGGFALWFAVSSSSSRAEQAADKEAAQIELMADRAYETGAPMSTGPIVLTSSGQ